jgi:hypothetical protein
LRSKTLHRRQVRRCSCCEGRTRHRLPLLEPKACTLD